jgi:hypothetical protein
MISIITFIDGSNDENNSNKYTIEKLFKKSIQSVIDQTYPVWELKIVIYNISDISDISDFDNSNLNYNYDFIQYNNRIDIIKYDKNDVNTPSKALIKVTENECKYKYISILDINDIWSSNKLEIQKNTLLRNPEIDILGSKSQYINDASNIPEGDLYGYNLFKVNPFIHSTVIIKKNVLKYIDIQEIININTNKNNINKNNTNKNNTNKNNTNKNNTNNTNKNNTELSFILNYLWVKLAIFQCVLYNINDITVTHNSVNSFQHYKHYYETNEFKNIVNTLKSKYIRVKIISDYCIPEHCKKEYERSCVAQTITYYGKTKKIYFTTSETYTHAILLNCPIVPNLQVDKNNVVGFAQEPHDTPFLRIHQNNFIDYAVKNIGKYFIGTVDKFPTPTFVGHHGFLFYETPKTIPFRPQKPKLMSIMVSHKSYTPGHQYRHILTQYILKNNLPIDIWGNGADFYKQQFPNNKNIKGGFKFMEEMCKDYLFTIAIENTSHDHYFTEKIINPFINNTIPIYWGCRKVEDYFPKHTIPLLGNVTKDVAIINNILNDPNKYLQEYKIDQEMVLNKVNLVKNIERIFNI